MSTKDREKNSAPRNMQVNPENAGREISWEKRLDEPKLKGIIKNGEIVAIESCSNTD